jgi:uncharacterized protein YraI
MTGTTSTQINVRADPLASGKVLGVLAASTGVEILGGDPGGNWYQITYQEGKDGAGWVASEYVKVQDQGRVPSLSGGSLPNGAILEKINVRSGPGTAFESLGTLEARDAVVVTGRDSAGTWLLIHFADAPEDRGWVAASFVQTREAEDLPVVSDSGELVGTSTPTGVPPTRMPTIAAAPEDGDSADAPSVSVRFTPSGTGSFFYSSDVSVPQGDATDWIAFTPYGSGVTIAVACGGNGALSIELLEAGAPLQQGSRLSCGQTTSLSLSAGGSYQLQLSAIADPAGLRYVRYTMSVDGSR